MEEDKGSDEVEEVSKDDKGELMRHLMIKKDEDIAIDAIPLATKLPVIIDYKLHKEAAKAYGKAAKSVAGEKITTADYNCLMLFYCQEDKDGLKR
ncbi:hypothetical protein Tco_0236299 [Tanacetum coccineum]